MFFQKIDFINTLFLNLNFIFAKNLVYFEGINKQ